MSLPLTADRKLFVSRGPWDVPADQWLLYPVWSPLLKCNPLLAKRTQQSDEMSCPLSGRLSAAVFLFTFSECPSAYTFWLSTLPCWRGSGGKGCIVFQHQKAQKQLPSQDTSQSTPWLQQGSHISRVWIPDHSYYQIINVAQTTKFGAKCQTAIGTNIPLKTTEGLHWLPCSF